MKLCYKIWLDHNGKAFGEGPCRLLTAVERLGSLNKAADELEMSYSKAWKTIKMAEKNLNMPLLERETGGLYGGGSVLTPEACDLLRAYRGFRREAEGELTRLYAKYFCIYKEE